MNYIPSSFPTRSTFSLAFLMQVTTGCALFFAVLVFSPPLAIVAALVVTPAIIRTGISAEQHQLRKIPFGVHQRIAVFVCSLGFVALVLVAGAAMFLLACVVSCLFGYGFGLLFGGQQSAFAMAVVSAIAGIVVGFAAMILGSAYVCIKYWNPVSDEMNFS